MTDDNFKEINEYPIIKKNELIRTTAFSLSRAEYDMLNYLMMKIKPEDTDLHPFDLVIREYCISMGLNPKDNYSVVKETAKGLADKSVWAIFEDENGVKESRVVRWIEDPIERQGVIRLQFKFYWKPFLIDVEKNYTSMVLQETLHMRCVYGKRTYELLKSYMMNRKGPITIKFTIEEYKRLLLGNKNFKSSYKDIDNFRRRVIEPAMKDMEDFGDLVASYRLLREGRSYKYIEFMIRERTFEEKLEVWEREKKASRAIPLLKRQGHARKERQ